jgi:plasmid maintenance system antidote protein VapI
MTLEELEKLIGPDALDAPLPTKGSIWMSRQRRWQLAQQGRDVSPELFGEHERRRRPVDSLAEAFGQMLREFLVRKGWSQRTAAKRLRRTQSDISMIICGKRREKTFKFFEAWADVFGLSVSEFFRELEVRVIAARPYHSRRNKRSDD